MDSNGLIDRIVNTNSNTIDLYLFCHFLTTSSNKPILILFDIAVERVD